MMSAGSSEILNASCKCPRDQIQGKKLVVCIDGTSNKYGDKNTNIVELYSHMVKNDKQLTYYNSGVGTYAKGHTDLKKQVSSVFDLALAFNISHTIMDAYRWLSDEYHTGDKIFLFGFSRGAYQVRALAGMIHEMGLIQRGNIEQIPYAFALYSAINRGREQDKLLAKGFRSTFSRQGVVIHFIGVWDTVSSVGIRKQKILPSTDTCDHICHFRQGLALDERRVKFLPEYVYGGMSNRPKSQSAQHPKGIFKENDVKEVWFAGSHSDVGGGNRKKSDNALDFHDMPLLWMREEALEAGLLLNPPKIAFRHEDLMHKINDSLTLSWWPLELVPTRRLCYNNSDQHTSMPHYGRGRIILPGQEVHASVLFRSHYRPKASFWRNFQQWPETIHFYVDYDQERLSPFPWEVPFKRSTAEALVSALHKKHIPDYVDRLAFMCSFKLGAEAVQKVNALETLEALLGIQGKAIANIKNAADEKEISPTAFSKENIDTDTAKEEECSDRRARLNALVAYCILVKDPDTSTGRILDSLNVPAMLEDPVYQGRACAALPALCKIETLRKKLLTEDMVSRIVGLCQKASEHKLIAMRTLSCLAQYFDETYCSQQSGFINEIFVMLKEKSAIVVVAALKILAAVASKGIILEDTQREWLVKRLKTLIKCRDFFVTPAAVAALCKISCHNDQLRAEAIRCDILGALIDLFEFDKQGLSGGPRGLKTLAEFGDVRKKLVLGPHIGKLVAFSRDKVVEKSNEATEELTELSIYDELRKRIIEERGLESIVDNLAKPDHALFAANALLTLMKYNDAKERILKPDVGLHLLQMIEERIFDGTIGREGGEGIDILAKIFQNDDLRSMMLKAEKPPSLDRNFSGKETIHKHSDKPRHPGNIIGILRKMIETTRPDSVQNSAIKNSAINYLCIIADHEDIHQAMIGVGIIELLLLCLESTDVDIRALNSVLEKIASCELLRSEIMKNGKILAEMLSSQDPVKLLRVAATLDSLSSHGEIRQIVQEMPEYKNLAEDALHYLYPHHHPHEHDLYTSASQAIKSIIWAFNAYNTKEKGRAYTK